MNRMKKAHPTKGVGCIHINNTSAPCTSVTHPSAYRWVAAAALPHWNIRRPTAAAAQTRAAASKAPQMSESCSMRGGCTAAGALASSAACSDWPRKASSSPRLPATCVAYSRGMGGRMSDRTPLGEPSGSKPSSNADSQLPVPLPPAHLCLQPGVLVLVYRLQGRIGGCREARRYWLECAQQRRWDAAAAAVGRQQQAGRAGGRSTRRIRVDCALLAAADGHAAGKQAGGRQNSHHQTCWEQQVSRSAGRTRLDCAQLAACLTSPSSCSTALTLLATAAICSQPHNDWFQRAAEVQAMTLITALHHNSH